MSSASSAQPVVVLGQDVPAGRALVERLRGDDRFALLQPTPLLPELAALLRSGARVIDVRGGPPQPLPDTDVLPACALVELGRERLSGARYLALPSAGAAAALLAAQPLMAHGLFDPDQVVLLLGAQGPGAHVQDLPSPAGEEIAAWLEALQLSGPPRLVATSLRAPIGGGVLAMVSGLVATADGGDPRVVRAAMLSQADEPGRRICDDGDLPDTSRVEGTDVAEIAAATEMLVERITCACALDALAFLPAAALRALEASIAPLPAPRSVPGNL